YDNYSIATDGMAFDDISVISHDVPPVANFSGTPTSGSYPLAVAFTDLSTNNPTSWSWTFGDGGTSTAQNPSHTYTAAGTYTVSLTATNAFGSDGETKTGYITVTAPSAWTTITYDGFESGWGSYTDGGGDCARYTGGTYAWSGNAAADIQDNSGTASSFYHTGTYNVSGYTDLEVEFYFVAVSMETNEDFWVQFYNGSSWVTVGSFASGTDFSNNTFYVATVSWNSSQVNFPTNARLRFMCDASNNTDDVYIDEITFRGSSGGAVAGLGGARNLAKYVPTLPDEISLTQNYPNPFNPTTVIAFTLPEAVHVRLEVFNLLGQRVETLINRDLPAGAHEVSWNALGMPSGTYLYRLDAGEFTQTRKMLLIK
ncbi:MAG: PKD domain-containing protein, partial [bacterium]